MISYRGTILARLPGGLMQVNVSVYNDGKLKESVTVQAKNPYRLGGINDTVGTGGLPIRQTSTNEWVIG